jgi:PQQ enzyme repeat
MNYTPSQRSEPKSSIVFTGVLDGRFGAYDGKSGNLLWQYDTSAVIWAPPATFAQNGERYVLVGSGGPGSMKVPELKRDHRSERPDGVRFRQAKTGRQVAGGRKPWHR